MKERSNVILFPQTIETLEKESFAAIDVKDYETALEKLELLLYNQVNSFAVNTGTMICLVKLNKYIEAENFCEELIKDKEDDHYFDYFMQYILLLFERDKHSELRDIIEETKKSTSIPDNYLQDYEELLKASQEMNESRAHDLLHEFELAVKENDHPKQWALINKWNQLRVQPTEALFTFLTLEYVHPMVKTMIIEIVKTYEINQKIEITKFGETMTIQSSALPKMDEHLLYQNVLEKIQSIEQENPTLFQLVKELLHQYHYVSYPFTFSKEDIDYVATALVHIGKQQLALETNVNEQKTNIYVKNIQACNEIYLNIMQQ